MYRDEVLAEVWRNRDAYVKKCHHDLDELVADLVKRQETPFTRLVDRRRAKRRVRAGETVSDARINRSK